MLFTCDNLKGDHSHDLQEKLSHSWQNRKKYNFNSVLKHDVECAKQNCMNICTEIYGKMKARRNYKLFKQTHQISG